VLHLKGVKPDSEPVLNKLFVIGLGIILGSIIVAHNPHARARLGVSELPERIAQPVTEDEQGPRKLDEEDAIQQLAGVSGSRLREPPKPNF